MGDKQGQRGFTLIGMLLSVVIVGVLMVMALQSYKDIPQMLTTGSGGSTGFSLAKIRMNELYTAETIYFSLHKSYGTFEQLLSDGQIVRGYSTRTAGAGMPFVPGHNLTIEVTESGFIATATPDPAAGASAGQPKLRITQEGVLEEIPE